MSHISETGTTRNLTHLGCLARERRGSVALDDDAHGRGPLTPQRHHPMGVLKYLAVVISRAQVCRHYDISYCKATSTLLEFVAFLVMSLSRNTRVKINMHPVKARCKYYKYNKYSFLSEVIVVNTTRKCSLVQ